MKRFFEAIRNRPARVHALMARPSAFTLIETVVLIAVFVFALIGLTNLFILFNSLYGYEQVSIATAGSASRSLTAFEAAVLPAERVLASHSFSGTTYESATSTLVLELPSIDATGTVIAGTKDYVAFYASSTTLYQLIEAGAGSARHSGRKQLSTTLFSLSFTYDAADFAQVSSVTCDLETRGTFKQQTVGAHVRGLLRLRNL